MGWLNNSLKLQPLQHQKQNAERRSEWLLLTMVLFSALHITASHAHLYKWVDENGRAQYTDAIPPASTDRARKELRSDGIVKSSTDRAATVEERRLATLKALEDAKLRSVVDERDRKDKALLNTYVSLVDFDRVRDRALGVLINNIRTLEERETLLNYIITNDGKLPPPVAGSRVAPLTALKSSMVKPADMLLLSAKSELPFVKTEIAFKRHDLEALTALYVFDRVRLSQLISTENAKLTIEQRTAQTQADLPVKTKQ